MKGQFSLHLSAVRRFGNDIISSTVAPQSAPDLVLSPAMRLSFQREDGIPKPKGTVLKKRYRAGGIVLIVIREMERTATPRDGVRIHIFDRRASG